jgi:hypothetical protein
MADSTTPRARDLLALRSRRVGITLMYINRNHVIVTRKDGECLWAHTSYAHHRNYPEIRAEGESPRVAAAQLATWLARALDDTPIGWRRSDLELALADARAFIEQPTT